MKNPFSKLRNPLRRGKSKESVVEVEAPAAQSMEKSTYTDEHMITLEELYQVDTVVFIMIAVLTDLITVIFSSPPPQAGD